MRVVLPQEISFGNARLAILYYLAVFAAFCASISLSVTSMSWMVVIPVQSFAHIRVDFHRSNIQTRQYDTTAECDTEHLLNAETDVYSTSFDVSHECKLACQSLSYGEKSTRKGCFDLLDMVSIRGLDVGITQTLKYYSMIPAKKGQIAGQDVEQGKTRVLLVPWAQAIGLHISISYSQISSTPWFFVDQQTSIDTDKAATKVLLDKHGQIFQVAPPGTVVHINVSDIFKSLSNATARGGSHLYVTSGCYNNNYDIAMQVKSKDVGVSATSKNPVCLLRFALSHDEQKQISLDGWTAYVTPAGKKEFRITESEVLLIQGKHSAGSFFRYYSLAGILQVVTSTIVLMSIPRSFIKFVMMHCLGTLSELYTQVLIKPFSVVRDSVGTAMRLLALTTLFSSVADLNTSISKQHATNDLKEALKTHSDMLDDQEIQDLAEFVYEQVAGWENTSAEDFTMPMSTLLLAFTQSEPVNVHMLAKLFDQNRATHLVERLFTPKEVANALNIHVMPRRSRGKELEEAAGSVAEIQPTSSKSSEDFNLRVALESMENKITAQLQKFEKRLNDAMPEAVPSSITDLEKRLVLLEKRLEVRDRVDGEQVMPSKISTPMMMMQPSNSMPPILVESGQALKHFREELQNELFDQLTSKLDSLAEDSMKLAQHACSRVERLAATVLESEAEIEEMHNMIIESMRSSNTPAADRLPKASRAVTAHGAPAAETPWSEKTMPTLDNLKEISQRRRKKAEGQTLQV